MKKSFFVFYILLLIPPLVHSQTRIKMQNENGVYTTPCVVNGLRLRFVFDTGASNVSISLSEALFMLKNGYLEEADLKGSSLSQIANGDVVKNTTVNLRELVIGGLKLYNVEAVIIHELSAPLLFGQSAIQKLGKIQIDGNELIIMNQEDISSALACSEANVLSKQALDYFRKGLYSLSAETYQKAYDMCPDHFSCWQYYFLGSAYSTLGKSEQSIKYLERAANCITDNLTLFSINTDLESNNFKLGNFDKAQLNIEKALFYAKEISDISYCYHELGQIKYEQAKYWQAISDYDKSITYYLKHISKTEDDVIKGRITDEFLGEKYWYLSRCYYKLEQVTKKENNMIKAALCGNKGAIDFCKEIGLKYDFYKD